MTMPTLPAAAQTRHWFTADKSREDAGDLNASFSAYRAGKRLQRASLRWNVAAEEVLHHRLTTACNTEFFATRINSQVPAHAESRVPI